MKKSKRLFFVLVLISILIYIPRVSAMQIFIEKESGDNISLEVESSDTIESVREKIYEKENILPEKQILTFNEFILQDGRTLADYNVYKGSTINLTIKVDEDKFSVVFDANGGVFKDNNYILTIEDWNYEDEKDLEIPIRDGYAFKGYYTEKEGGTKFEMILNESGIDDDMTFYAHWEENSVLPEFEEENPKTFDGIGNNILIGIISLVGVIIYLKKM